MRKLKFGSQKGAISAFVMISMSFFLVTILGIYMISAKRAQTQTQSISIAQDKYYVEGEENETYNSKVANASEVIPIYTKEQLYAIGTNNAIEIEGKVYKFTSSATYELKNDIIINIETTTIPQDFSSLENNGYNVYYYYNGEYYDYNPAGTQTINGKKYNFANLSEKLGYVTRGLMVHYDGIMNKGLTHDNSATTWKDLSGNGNDATIYGGTWNSNSLSFDGVDDWATLNNLISGTNQFSIEYTTNQKQNKSWEYLWGLRENYFGLESGASDYRYFYYNTIGNSNHVSARLDGLKGTNGTIVSNVITVSSNNTMKAYLNGEKKYETILTEGIYKTGDKFGIAADGFANYRMLIDYYDFKIYNTVLTDAEVTQNFQIDQARFDI